MVFNREEAARRAEASRTNIPGTCQLWTHVMFGTPSAGDFDGDGAADAEDGWKMEPAKAKHPGDRHPPRGVPVSYLGGSHDNGHRAVSLGKGMIRSTDAGGTGIVATVPLNWPEVHWGLTYAGWSTTCDGVEIPLPPPPPPPLPKRLSARGIFHVHGKAFYYEEDSLRGFRLALAKLLGIDFDVQKTKDGVLIVAHGPRPLADRLTGGFMDPEADTATDPVRPKDTYADLTWAQVQRLRSKADPPKGEPRYRISRADVLIPKAVKAGVKVIEAEAKSSHITTADWTALRAAISDPSKVRVKAFPKFLPSLKAAAGLFPLVILTHKGQERVPSSARVWLEGQFFRGRKPIWV